MNQYVVAALAAVMSLVAGVILYKIFIPVLRKVKLGAVILEVGPNWHKSKAGTPIMGGVIFIISTAAAFFTAYFVLMDGAFTPRLPHPHRFDSIRPLAQWQIIDNCCPL